MDDLKLKRAYNEIAIRLAEAEKELANVGGDQYLYGHRMGITYGFDQSLEIIRRQLDGDEKHEADTT